MTPRISQLSGKENCIPTVRYDRRSRRFSGGVPDLITKNLHEVNHRYSDLSVIWVVGRSREVEGGRQITQEKNKKI
jgi:hypothetical protein